nr:MAG TPA: hypothetical protein [Caudoviricetes sp.]
MTTRSDSVGSTSIESSSSNLLRITKANCIINLLNF